VFADYQSYADCQTLVDESYRDQEGWTRMSILNSARSGKFSSDRTIREYCNEIWNAKAVPVQLLTQEEVKAASCNRWGVRSPATKEVVAISFGAWQDSGRA
jgi:starch phosphorylase